MIVKVDWTEVYKKNVLVVDDSLSFRQLTSGLLKHIGFKEIEYANSGAEAVERYEKGGVDILFLDIDMPGMSGMEALEAIIAFDALAYVIMLSGHTSDEYVNQAKERGVKGFISKPLNPPEMKSKLIEFAELNNLVTT